MSATAPHEVTAARRRRRQTTAIKSAMRDLNNQLSLFNRNIGARVELKDVDFDCLELLNRHGPLSPSALARRAGLHPATMTGIIDRLERGRWVTRERDPQASDRRAVTVRAIPDRGSELYRLFKGMNGSMDRICADYTEAELDVIANFLQRATSAGRDATEKLNTE